MGMILKQVEEKENYFKDILKIIKKSDQKICYVTFNKTCDAIKNSLKKEQIALSKVFIIDCISGIIKKPKPSECCAFISEPYDLPAIKKLIKKAIKEDYTYIIFDALSNIVIYEAAIPAGLNILGDFIKSFQKNLEDKKGNAIFICKAKSSRNLLIRETLSLFKQ
jgi:hypothetical protein|tara:strand:- start:102 stop:596 length:495 start_codon:yes stop_codon:yes gene_type:complete